MKVGQQYECGLYLLKKIRVWHMEENYEKLEFNDLIKNNKKLIKGLKDNDYIIMIWINQTSN